MSSPKRVTKFVHYPFQLKLIGLFLVLSCCAALVQVLLLGRAFRGLESELPVIAHRIQEQVPGQLGNSLL